MKDYKKILEGIVDIINTTEKSDIGFTNICAYVGKNCPELKDSEDEKIRKQILSFLKEFECDHYRNLDFSSWIAWLEKQGEQKFSRFKVGDWITCKKLNTALILDIENGKYFAEFVDGSKGFHDIDYIDNHFHLWTIDDAKYGDVIVCESKHGQEIGIVKKFVGKYGGCGMCFVAYCFVDWDGIFRVSEYMGSRNIHPATKEQRDALFARMKDEGYEWDAEKKELKKIEQSNEENYEIDGLFYAKTILEKTLGKVEGYQTDDGILEHKSAIIAVEKLCEQNPTWSKEDLNIKGD